MKHRIYKYNLFQTIGTEQSITMPVEAVILDFRFQYMYPFPTPSGVAHSYETVPVPVIWAAVTDAAVEERKFILRYTGDSVDLRVRDRFDAGMMYGSERYIGTDIESSSGLVYHLFEVVQ